MKQWMEPDMALIIFDVSSSSSSANLNHWLELIKSIKWNTSENQPNTIAVFANKIDLTERRVIGSEFGEQFANQSKIQYFEGSAVSNTW